MSHLPLLVAVVKPAVMNGGLSGIDLERFPLSVFHFVSPDDWFSLEFKFCFHSSKLLHLHLSLGQMIIIGLKYAASWNEYCTRLQLPAELPSSIHMWRNINTDAKMPTCDITYSFSFLQDTSKQYLVMKRNPKQKIRHKVQRPRQSEKYKGRRKLHTHLGKQKIRQVKTFREGQKTKF